MTDDPIAYAIPVFALALLVEYWTTRTARHYDVRDGRTSVGMGIGALLVGIPHKLLFLWAMYQVHAVRLMDIGTGVGAWLALWVIEDLCYYWSHRMNHEARLLWAAHVNHHSSEHYNLTTALRQSWTQPFLIWIFWMPLPLLGFDPLMVMTIQTTNLIYQFFIHTQAVDRLGPLEWVFNTPSHHRVHHAVNPRYLDRNHGGTLILWDRLFGTFTQELAVDPPRFGITKNIGTYNLWTVAFHEWVQLARDVRRAPTWSARIGYLLHPPGWKPDGSGITSSQLRAGAQSRAAVTPPNAVPPAPPALAHERPVDP